MQPRSIVRLVPFARAARAELRIKMQYCLGDVERDVGLLGKDIFGIDTIKGPLPVTNAPPFPDTAISAVPDPVSILTPLLTVVPLRPPVPMSEYRDIAGDWHKNGTRDHDITDVANVLLMTRHSTDGYFDLRLNCRGGKESQQFRRSSGRYRRDGP